MMTNYKDDEVIEWAMGALMLEAEALKRTAKLLDGAFAQAVRAILASSGKVVVTGLGKSGHIGRKIAATLASTGTSSFFVHPAEALHGDFGMIGKSDVLLAIAFGGETREVVEVAKFARRLPVPIIAITGRKDSSLAKLASYSLDGSVDREACPLNLAPTSSSTVALAIGDALAVSLMKARGFREEDFAALHPEGSLGKRLSLTGDHMHPFGKMATLKASDDFHTVLEMVTRNNFGIAAVLSEDGSIIGAITDGDLRRAVLKYESQVFSHVAGDLMTRGPKTIPVTTLAVDAFKEMESHNITSLFVVDADDASKPVGLVRMHDLLAAKIV